MALDQLPATPRRKHSAHISGSRFCASCGWPIIFLSCKGVLAQTEPYASYQRWFYCSNKSCARHDGEGTSNESIPKWAASDETHTPVDKAERRQDLVTIATEACILMRAAGFTLQRIADELNTKGFDAPMGRGWSPMSIMRLLKRSEATQTAVGNSSSSSAGRRTG